MYPHKKVFTKPEEQEQYIRDWLAQRAGLLEESQALRIVFYSARYHPELGSIFSVGDVPALIPDDEADALILEEPEHLNWCVGFGIGMIWRSGGPIGGPNTTTDSSPSHPLILFSQ